jgi:hypothetical protein
MSAFDEPMILILKKNQNKTVKLEVETNDRGFTNIKRFLGVHDDIGPVKTESVIDKPAPKVYDAERISQIINAVALINAGKTTPEAIAIIKELRERL